MPIYEYLCAHCGDTIEVFQKVSDHPLIRCPACKTESLTKLISMAGFRLKGEGWYETDFKGTQDKKKNLVTEEVGSVEKSIEKSSAETSSSISTTVDKAE